MSGPHAERVIAGASAATDGCRVAGAVSSTGDASIEFGPGGIAGDVRVDSDGRERSCDEFGWVTFPLARLKTVLKLKYLSISGRFDIEVRVNAGKTGACQVFLMHSHSPTGVSVTWRWRQKSFFVTKIYHVPCHLTPTQIRCTTVVCLSLSTCVLGQFPKRRLYTVLEFLEAQD